MCNLLDLNSSTWWLVAGVGEMALEMRVPEQCAFRPQACQLPWYVSPTTHQSVARFVDGQVIIDTSFHLILDSSIC